MEGKHGNVRYEISTKPPGNWFTSLFKASATAHFKVLQMIDIGIPYYNVSNHEFFEISLICLFSLWFREQMKRRFVAAVVPLDH